jgi:ubiquinone/menaquinone biosynthesis C-methylase UbiE
VIPRGICNIFRGTQRDTEFFIMNEFDIKAAEWDNNPMHLERSAAIVKNLARRVPLDKRMSVLEFGAGTGITSFLLKDLVGKIIMMDSSVEMVNIMSRKIEKEKIRNLKPVFFDLEREDWTAQKFDLIISQMVLHHISDIDSIIGKLHNLLKPGGILAIADLYNENGSFHGPNFTGHRGFNPESLVSLAGKKGFLNFSVEKCFTIKKKITDDQVQHFDLFLLIAGKASE